MITGNPASPNGFKSKQPFPSGGRMKVEISKEELEELYLEQELSTYKWSCNNLELTQKVRYSDKKDESVHHTKESARLTLLGK